MYWSRNGTEYPQMCCPMDLMGGYPAHLPQLPFYLPFPPLYPFMPAYEPILPSMNLGGRLALPADTEQNSLTLAGPSVSIKIEDSEEEKPLQKPLASYELPISESEISIMQVHSYDRSMLETLTRNVGIDPIPIEQKRQQLAAGQDQFPVQIFDTLLRKFQRLRKTKEQQIKYCMRKSFKFAVDRYRKQQQPSEKNNIVQYFQRQHLDENFVVPFKKNSSQKTMNSTFLSRIFNSRRFVEDYRQFLGMLLADSAQFKALAWKDNNKKISAYVPIVEECLREKNLKVLDGYRRLPWTAVIINKCEELARRLLQYSQFEEGGMLGPEPPASTHEILKEQEDTPILSLLSPRPKKTALPRSSAVLDKLRDRKKPIYREMDE